MSLITKQRTRVLSLIVAVLTLGALVMPLVGVAQANHGTRTLEVTPELETYATGATAVLTAVLLNEDGSGEAPADATSGTINIDFEVEGGTNDPDGGSTRQSPDLTCTVAIGSNTCTVSLTGNSESSSNVVGWIDHDGFNSTDNSDPDEGRRSTDQSKDGFDDCDQAQDSPSDCGSNLFALDVAPQPGSGCALVPDDSEPDCTDVVRISFSNTGAVPTTLDCDDRSGSQTQDTERETNPSRTDVNDQSTERYRCHVRDQFGSGVNGVTVKGENENGVNDPDGVDGASYDTPDYGCSSTSRDPDRPPGFSADTGICYISVEQLEGELGTAEICFWVGTAAEGASLCANEPTGENQQPDGTDTGNDLADQVEKTWELVDVFTLDCNPETSTNPAGSDHTITCTATDPSSSRTVSGVTVDFEITGAGDPDDSDTPQTRDGRCTTGTDGACEFTHSSASEGETEYRAWINDNDPEPRDDGTDEDVDRTEGRDESAQPGEIAEPDGTDVVAKTWGPAPTALVISPKQDTASVGECNPYTITLTAGSGPDATPVEGATIDVEQIHSRATNNTTGDEPKVDFCVPSSGPNPSDVDTSRGDLGPGSQQNDAESPDNSGTAGGETVNPTDSTGRVTIGIEVTPSQNSDGTGTVNLTAFYDGDDDDDADAGEPSDSATKIWEAQPAGEARSIFCTPETATNPARTNHVITCTVQDADGRAVEGEGVTWNISGAGRFVGTPQAATDQNGKATATITSDDVGESTVTATLTADTGEGEPSDEDECDRSAGDPAGAPAGQCSDTVTKTWTEPEERCPDHESDTRNHIVGTDGDDTIQGTEGDDIICGLAGDDLIDGLGGNDFIIGGEGNDSLRGGEGDDVIEGGAGKDELRGNGGNDELRGGDQNDDLRGNAGDDVMLGQSGFDVLRGGAGNDEGRGGSGNDTLQGFTGKDLLVGNAGNDTIKGAGGRDELRGGKDDDVISGGRGPDKIRGGPGRDVCAGGAGNNDTRGCEA